LKGKVIECSIAECFFKGISMHFFVSEMTAKTMQDW